MKIEEIRIPAPWGHIAAKAWGDEEYDVILLWHGLLDNAATFDNLIPLLSNNFYYVCVDLAGHGRSSNFDHPLPLNIIDHLLAQKIVCDYFQRDRYIFIAHSYSVIVSTFFTMTYPKLVSKLILLDLIAQYPMYPRVFAEKLIRDIDLNNLAKKRDDVQTYTFDKCIQKVADGRNHADLTRDYAESLVHRMVKEIDNEKYVFTVDKRIGFILPMDLDYILELYKLHPFQCPVLILITTKFALNHFLKQVYNYFKTLENIKMHIVSGHHYVHLTNPERISGYITKFLRQNNGILIKAWGESTNEAVIVSHGLQDNAASFDRLIPLLPRQFYYICFDLPGHGLSDHFPKSTPIHFVNFFLAYMTVADFFQRSKYVFIAHSYGGILSILFAQLYPEIVKKLIMIDVMYVIPIKPADFIPMIRAAHSVYFKNLQPKPEDRPSYTYEEIVKLNKEYRQLGWITSECAEILTKRMIEPVGNGRYVITMDQKLKAVILPNATIEYYMELFKARPVKCPTLMLVNPNNKYNVRVAGMLKCFEEAGFLIKRINAQHYVHLVNPEVIAAKLWGDPINQPILVIHGVFDNAGAFDNLIPHLPENYYYICIDLPSHGKSSQFPPFLPIHMVDFLSPTRIVMDYFQRDKYIFMGHSLGGQIMMFYAQLYPERISRIILLDSLYLFPLNEDVFLDFTKDAVDRVFRLLEQNKGPKQIYTYEEAVQKLIDGREHGQMTREAAEPIARRMFEEVSEGKYVMNIDHRLKERLYPSGSFNFMTKLHRKKPVAKPVLILLSTQRCLWDLFGPLYDQYVKMGYEIHKYEGHHDMHATNPEILAPFIVKFLLKDANKL